MHGIFAFLTALALVSSAITCDAADVAILMPGSGGIHPGDFLVRNEASFKRAGIHTVVTTSPAAAAAAVAEETAKRRKSVIVGMSRGAGDAAAAIAAGARPAGLVFVSGVYARAMSALGTPAALPPTLVVHHSHDICNFTLPGAASEFVAWTGGKARLHWINNTGEPSSDPCNARGAHGFFREDGPAVAAIISFIRSR